METFFGKRSLLINIKIKAVMNKNIFKLKNYYLEKSIRSQYFNYYNIIYLFIVTLIILFGHFSFNFRIFLFFLDFFTFFLERFSSSELEEEELEEEDVKCFLLFFLSFSFFFGDGSSESVPKISSREGRFLGESVIEENRTGISRVVCSIRTLGDSSTETDGINECHKEILHKLDLLPQKLGETHRISELRNKNFDQISSSPTTTPSTSTTRLNFYKRPTTSSARPIEESSHPLDEPLIIFKQKETSYVDHSFYRPF